MCTHIDPKVEDERPANPAEYCGNYEIGKKELERYRAEIQAEIDEVGYPEFWAINVQEAFFSIVIGNRKETKSERKEKSK